MCEKESEKQSGHTKVREEEGGGGAPGAEENICCSPWTAHAEADNHCSPLRATPEQIFAKGLQEGRSMLEQGKSVSGKDWQRETMD